MRDESGTLNTLNAFQLPSHCPVTRSPPTLLSPLMAHKRQHFSCVSGRIHQAGLRFLFSFWVCQWFVSLRWVMKRVSLHNGAQVMLRCNYRNPVSCEYTRRMQQWKRVRWTTSWSDDSVLQSYTSCIFQQSGTNPPRQIRAWINKELEDNLLRQRFRQTTTESHVWKSSVIQSRRWQ